MLVKEESKQAADNSQLRCGVEWKGVPIIETQTWQERPVIYTPLQRKRAVDVSKAAIQQFCPMMCLKPRSLHVLCHPHHTSVLLTNSPEMHLLCDSQINSSYLMLLAVIHIGYGASTTPTLLRLIRLRHKMVDSEWIKHAIFRA